MPILNTSMFFPKLPWRLLPANGEVPAPGEDWAPNPQTEWLQPLHKDEVALFYTDRQTNLLLTADGRPAEECAVKYCVAFSSRFYAELVARRTTAKHPHMQCAMYDSGGRWIETYSLQGVRRRNPIRRSTTTALRYASAIIGCCLSIILASAAFPSQFGGDRIRWTQLSTTMKSGVVVAGVLCTILAVVAYNTLRKVLYKWAAWPSNAAWGSQRREYFYKQLAAESPALFVPTEITLDPCQITWPSPEEYEKWSTCLEQNRFYRFGSFASPETNLKLEFWLNDSEEFCAEIVTRHKAEMWMSVTTYYGNNDCFCVVNKDKGVIEPRPGNQILYVGLQSTAEEVIEKARRERPAAAPEHQDPATLIDEYRRRWQENVLWLRNHRLTPQQRKLLSERYRARKQNVGPQ